MKGLLLWLLRAYQKAISPLLGSGKCRFEPTCSHYALEAVEIRGAFWGLLLACWRVLRCNPFCRGGYDPVPTRKDTSSNP
ncbi:MAG: membrane protein insertion efficiency factor YidD [Planctomycetota bacterium]|nr:membrane protein insertion efficiency factor YidD [Planctomycetota bacterium]MDP6942230.1 membrane protein insertion efficiency factor YidD [Planctomycetota bacterium]